MAELSGNHGGDIKKAFELIDCAVENGADAVKIQTYKAETITVDSRDERFLLKDGIWKGQYLFDLYKDAMTPGNGMLLLQREQEEEGLPCLVLLSTKLQCIFWRKKFLLLFIKLLLLK